MELNPRNKKAAKVILNEESSLVIKRRPEIQLYLEASNLNLKKDSFYTSAKDKLNSILSMASSQDKAFVLGLSKFLADKGLKTSPVLLLSALSNGGYPFVGQNVNYIFNTPKRIAEAVALQNMGLVKLNNSFKKRVLKTALENMEEHTLKKAKMKRNKVKLRDLIKLLRPTPHTPKKKDLYKAIIQNSNEASLKEEGRNMVAIKSSTKLTKEEKKEEIAKNIEDIPINQLIRNLKFLAEEYDFEKNIEMQKKVVKQLSSIKNYRFLNIFDVITAAVYVPVFEKALFEVVKKFISNLEFKFDGDATVLFDISGSMLSNGEVQDNLFKGLLYLALFSRLFKVDLYTFAESLQKKDKCLPQVIELLEKGAYARAHKIFKEYAQKNSGGTALLNSARDLLDSQKVHKNFIIISDEVSWTEGSNLTGAIDELSNKVADRNLIVINPAVSVGTVFKKNVLAVSSLNPSILTDMSILVDEQGFINYIRKYKEANKNDTLLGHLGHSIS